MEASETDRNRQTFVLGSKNEKLAEQYPLSLLLIADKQYYEVVWAINNSSNIMILAVAAAVQRWRCNQ